MNPRLKKLIIIANIVAYVAICGWIYLKRKGGWKALRPEEKPTLQERMAMAQKGKPAPTKPAPKRPGEKPAPKKPAPEKVEAARAPKRAPVPKLPEIRVVLPSYIAQTKRLLEQMRAKEKTLRSGYYAGPHRDPFIPLIGIENYLAGIKLTPDGMAELPYGLPDAEKRKASPFNLVGTVKAKKSESAVIINGQILYKGDIIDGYTVTDITRRKTTLKSGKRVITLKIPFDESQAITEKTEESQVDRVKREEKGQEHESDIRGGVRDSEDNLVKGATVVLHSEDGPLIYKGVTDSKGLFHIYAPHGKYILEVGYFGHKSHKQKIDLWRGHTTILSYSISLQKS